MMMLQHHTTAAIESDFSTTDLSTPALWIEAHRTVGATKFLGQSQGLTPSTGNTEPQSEPRPPGPAIQR